MAKLKSKLQELGVSSTGSKDALVARLQACSAAGAARTKTTALKAAVSVASPSGQTVGRSRVSKESENKRAASSEPPAPAAKRSKGDADPPRKASKAKGMALFEEKKLEFQTWTNEKLKLLLKSNDQSRTGNKAVLVAKCADGAAFGRLPRCPKCLGGKIKFRLPDASGNPRSIFSLFGGAYGQDKVDEKNAEDRKTKKLYYCTGYHDDDEKIECDWQADTIKRLPWKSA